MISRQIVEDVLQEAKRKGATATDLVLVENELVTAQVRLRETEMLRSAREVRLGLRLFFDKRSATSSTSDLSKESLARLVEDTAVLAKAIAHDEYSGLPLLRNAPRISRIFICTIRTAKLSLSRTSLTEPRRPRMRPCPPIAELPTPKGRSSRATSFESSTVAVRAFWVSIEVRPSAWRCRPSPRRRTACNAIIGTLVPGTWALWSRLKRSASARLSALSDVWAHARSQPRRSR